METSGFIVSVPDNWTKEDGDQATSCTSQVKEGPETMPCEGGKGRPGRTLCCERTRGKGEREKQTELPQRAGASSLSSECRMMLM